MTERPRSRSGGRPTTRSRAAATRPIDTEAERIAELEARIARLEKSPGLRERGRGLMARVVPDEATQHFFNAGREQLLGIRSMVDFWIDRIDEVEDRSRSGSRREAIPIEEA
jgi:hypothetical protein